MERKDCRVLRLAGLAVTGLKVRFTDEELAWLRERASERGISQGAVVRSVLQEAIAGHAAARGRTEVEAALDRVLRKHVDRLAKLVAKGAMGAHASKYLLLYLITDGGKRDGRDIYQQALSRASADLRARDDEQGDDPS